MTLLSEDLVLSYLRKLVETRLYRQESQFIIQTFIYGSLAAEIFL